MSENCLRLGADPAKIELERIYTTLRIQMCGNRKIFGERSAGFFASTNMSFQHGALWIRTWTRFGIHSSCENQCWQCGPLPNIDNPSIMKTPLSQNYPVFRQSSGGGLSLERNSTAAGTLPAITGISTLSRLSSLH